MKLTAGQIEFMIEELSSEIIQMLMEEWGCDMTQAMDIYYNSDTFDRLSNPATGLYYQSAGYVYDFLKKKIHTGGSAKATFSLCYGKSPHPYYHVRVGAF